MPVEVQLAEALDTAPAISAAALNRALAALFDVTHDKRLQAEICVRICDAAESRRLNAAYRGKDQPTNVLSFAVELDHAVEDAPLGDLVVCWPVVLQEAQAQGKPPLHHFLHLFVHGTLHLLGHDHEDAGSAAQMEAVEVDVLDALGIADPYQV